MTGRRILVVEDDTATAAALEVALTGAGYRVTTAADGEALKLKFVDDKVVGINIKTYGAYVAGLDRGERGSRINADRKKRQK